MTDEPHTDDSTDAQPRTPSGDVPTSGLDRRGFLKKTAVAGVALSTGLASATGSASAEQNRLRVVSSGQGHSYYEIHMEGNSLSSESPSIQCAEDCEGNDTTQIEETGVGRYLDHHVASGHVWNDGEDVFTYTGEVDYVLADGKVAFVSDDKTFLAAQENGGHVYVDGLGSGRHDYVLATYSGDIDSYEDEPGDVDDKSYDDEGRNTYDEFDGVVWNHKRDSLSLSHGPLNYVEIEGHARVWLRFES